MPILGALGPVGSSASLPHRCLSLLLCISFMSVAHAAELSAGEVLADRLLNNYKQSEDEVKVAMQHAKGYNLIAASKSSRALN